MRFNPPPTPRSDGYTLVEVMMAVFVFSLVALGITATVIQSQRIAVSNILRSTAHNTAQGYLEQIKTLSSSEINESLDDPVNVPLPTIRLDPMAVNTNPGDIEVADPLYLDQSNAKAITLNIDKNDGNKLNTMQMSITPMIENLNDPSYGADAVPAYEVTLDFDYEVRHLRGTSRQTGSLRMIMADV